MSDGFKVRKGGERKKGRLKDFRPEINYALDGRVR